MAGQLGYFLWFAVVNTIQMNIFTFESVHNQSSFQDAFFQVEL